MKISKSKSITWLTHVVTLAAGVLAAFAAVYFGQVIRSAADLSLGIVSVEKFSPEPRAIDLSPGELLDLDNATSETILELSDLHRGTGVEFLKTLEEFDDSNPAATLSNQAMLREFEKNQPVSIELLDTVLEAIENSPSSTLTRQAQSVYEESVRNLSTETARAFWDSLQDLLEDELALGTAINAFHKDELDELQQMALGLQPEVISQLPRIKEAFLSTAEGMDLASGMIQDELVETRKKVTLLVEESKKNADGESRLDIRVVLSNNGQIPLVISRFAVLVLGGEFLVPLERSDISENALVLPESAMEIVYSTPSKSASESVWNEMIQHGVRRSGIVCRVLVQPTGDVVHSEENEFFNVLDEQQNVVNQLVETGERLSLDL